MQPIVVQWSSNGGAGMLVCCCEIKPVDNKSRTKLNEEKREKKLTWGPNDDMHHLGPHLILVPPSCPHVHSFGGGHVVPLVIVTVIVFLLFSAVCHYRVHAFRAPVIHGWGRVLSCSSLCAHFRHRRLLIIRAVHRPYYGHGHTMYGRLMDMGDCIPSIY